MPKKSRLGKQFTERLIASSEPPPEQPESKPAPLALPRDRSQIWKYGFVLRREHSEYLDELVTRAFLKTKKKVERSAVIRALIDLLKMQQVDISECSTETEIREVLKRQLGDKP
ncbi:hypothetical protein HYR54_15375 [Candidatus Acetothermia bacterium]|nr:hypothetical protein [Candidatus Acetothermia bacterium]